MGINAITISNSSSTNIPLTDDNGDHIQGRAQIWNPVTNSDRVAIHENGAAGVTPVAETHSTASLTVVTDTTAGAVAIADARRFVDDAGKFWDVDTGQGVTNAAATAGTGEVTVTGDTDEGSVHIPAGSRVCKAGENVTGPFWALDDDVDLTAATYSTAVGTFTIDNDGQAVTIPEGQQIKKAAVATTWSSNAASVTPSATPSTAVVQFTGAQNTAYPIATVVKKALVATEWTTDAEAVIINGVTATAGAVLGVEVVGTPATVVTAGSRICKTGEDAGGPFWTADANITIGGTGIGHGNFTCGTTGAIAAAIGSLNVIKDAIAGWDGVENDAAATPGLDAADGTIGAAVTCSINGATVALAGSLDTVTGPPVGHTSVTNAVQATLGLPIVATVPVDVTCDVIGDEAATAGTLDTIVTAPANVSAVTNAVDAVVGASEVPTATVGITCLTKDAIAALTGTIDTIKDAVAGWTAVSNADAVTPGVEKDYTNTITVTAVDGGAIAADAGAITALETAITGVVSITNAAPATPGADYVEGSAVDFTLVPGSGHPFDGAIATMQGKALGSAPVVVQLLTGADALQEDMAATPEPLPAFTAADPGITAGATTGAETLYAEQTGNGASQVALAANALRKKACIANAATSTTPLWIGQGVTAEANKGIRVDPGGCYNWDSLNPFYGAINVYAAATCTWSRSES